MSQSRPDNLRGLKALVAFLGILVVLGTAVVVGVVIRRLYAPPAPASNSLAPAAAMLPPGSRILGIAAAGNSFGIWVADPAGGDRVYVLDAATGALRLAVQAVGPKN